MGKYNKLKNLAIRWKKKKALSVSLDDKHKTKNDLIG